MEYASPEFDSAGVIPIAVEQEFKANESLDLTQKDAIKIAMTKDVALIQGPPGTGKTFVGVFVANALVRSSKETILCVCYTNHALDQFLEALLDKGITDLVRIGGKSKSERLEPFNLNSGAGGRRYLPDSIFRRISALHDKDKYKSQVQRRRVLREGIHILTQSLLHFFRYLSLKSLSLTPHLLDRRPTSWTCGC